jgi:HAD superfamily hydrolase (TIGR01549 family)
MESAVSEWLYQRPLKYLRLCRHRGIEAFLSFLAYKGLQVGVFSDYPAVDKLRALGLFDRIPLVLCATDPEINAFKPHPKGFLRACTVWGLPPEEVLYVGDRPEIDAVGAAAAGMPCAILSKKGSISSHKNPSIDYVTLFSFAELQQAFANSR